MTDRVQEEANRFLAAVLSDLKAEGDEEGIDESYVYTHELRSCERFMLAGNGPSAWVNFVFDDKGDVDHSYIEYADAGGTAIAVVPHHIEDELLEAFRRSAARGIDR